MKRRTGLYPGVQVDAAACGVVSQAGGVALLEAVTVSGLDRLLSVGLEPWRAPRAVHDPANVLLDLAVTLALGGDCLADVAVLRAEPGVYGRVASDPTVLAHDRRAGRGRTPGTVGDQPGPGSCPGRRVAVRRPALTRPRGER